MTRPSILLLAFLVPSLLVAQEPTVLTSQQIFQKAKAATVVILAGEGAGRLRSISTGILVSRSGIVVTALHAVKDAAEVQVRLASGEVFDNVQLLGSDERRDVAALKIEAGGLPFLSDGSSASLVQGDAVYAVTNADGLTLSATEGIFSATRPAEEVEGAGTGFRLIQFTAPVAPGSSGGGLIDTKGALVGIITRGTRTGAAFAVPIESVEGLASQGPVRRLGSGASLQLPAKLAADVPQSSAAVANADPKQILKNATTVHVSSKTAFLTVDTLDRALLRQKDWDKLKLTLVQDPRVADVLIEIDRPLFTYVHTFVIQDKRTSILLGAGKVTAFDGTTASGPLADQIVHIFSEARVPKATAGK